MKKYFEDGLPSPVLNAAKLHSLALSDPEMLISRKVLFGFNIFDLIMVSPNDFNTSGLVLDSIERKLSAYEKQGKDFSNIVNLFLINYFNPITVVNRN